MTVGRSPSLSFSKTSQRFRREVKLVVVPTAGVKRGHTERAKIAAVHIFANGEFVSACPAKNCASIPLGTRPNPDVMPGKCFVAVLARVVDAAAGHFDGNNVALGVVVQAACRRVWLNSLDFRSRCVHSKEAAVILSPLVSMRQFLVSLFVLPPLRATQQRQHEQVRRNVDYSSG